MKGEVGREGDWERMELERDRERWWGERGGWGGLLVE